MPSEESPSACVATGHDCDNSLAFASSVNSVYISVLRESKLRSNTLQLLGVFASSLVIVIGLLSVNSERWSSQIDEKAHARPSTMGPGTSLLPSTGKRRTATDCILRPRRTLDFANAKLAAAMDCSNINGSARAELFLPQVSTNYQVCRSVEHPGRWACPRGYKRQRSPPFCIVSTQNAAASRPGCKVTEMSAPSTIFLNGCFNGSTLRHGESCNLTCLPCWRRSGVQPSCINGVFYSGSLACNFDAQTCAIPTPGRGHAVCHRKSIPVRLPRVAYCMAGHARTLYIPKNYHSLKYNVLDAFGADTKLFGYLKMDDSVMDKVDPLRTEQDRKLKPKSLHVTRRMLEPALQHLGFTNLTFANDQYPPPLNKMCVWKPSREKGGSWGQYTARSVAQMISLGKCFNMIEHYENSTGKTFDLVVRLRPDDFWIRPILPYCAFENLNTTSRFTAYGDWNDMFMMFPRSIASFVFKLNEEYYACRGRTIQTGKRGYLEGWIEHTVRTRSAQLGMKMELGCSFPRALHRFNGTGSADKFCHFSPIEDDSCLRVLYEET